MKKLFLLMSMASAIISFAGCQKNEIEGGNDVNGVGSTFDLVADIEQTKTTLDGLSVNWEEGDVIYMVTSDGTWGKAYADDDSGNTIADFIYGDGKFSTEATISDGTYTFKAMYASASQRTYHRGTSSTHKLEPNQSQNCTNPTAHIKLNDALVGTFEATTPMTEAAKVTMSHLYTMMQVDVKNNTGADIEITSFEMSAGGAVLAGVFNVTDFSTPAISPKTGQSEAIKVTMSGGTVAAGGTLPIYFVAAPFTSTTEGGITFKVTVAGGTTYTKTVNKVLEFKAGEYNTTSYTISTPDEVSAKQLPFEETFESSLGEFTSEGELPDGLSYVWKHDSKYKYAKASAYVSDKRYEQTNYLVSPVLDLTDVDGAMVSFEHAGSYFSGNEAEQAKLCVREKGGEWNELSIPVYFTGWTFVNSGSIDLSSYAGKKIQIGFKYSSTSSVAGTWEIKNVSVVAGAPAPQISGVKTPDMISADGAEASISYSVINPTSGKTISAATEATWITSFDYATDGIIKFNVAANSTSSVRSADVTLSYEGAESVTVTVSQEGQPLAGTTEATLTFDDKSKRTNFSTDSQTWEENSLVLTNNKGSGSNLADYAAPVRFYKNSEIVISAPGKITQIKFVCNTADYAISLNKSILGSAVSGAYVTVTLDGTSTSATYTLSDGQVRMDAVTVTYLPDGTTPEPATLESISVENPKKSYTVGDTFVEPTVKGTYSDYSVKTLTGATFSGYDMSKEGTQTVTVSYEGKTTTYDITIASKPSVDGDVISMDIFANAGTLSGKTISWTIGGFTCMNEQANSTTAIRTSDSDHFRAYAKSVLKFTSSEKTFNKVVVTCTSDSYATKLAGATYSAGVSASATGSEVTIVSSSPVSEISATISEQARIKKVTVELN